MSRAEIRQHIFRMLFRIEFHSKQEMPEQMQFYFEALEEISDVDWAYIDEKFQAILKCREEIDRMIDEHTTGWKTTRMNKVDLTILRLAVYEMKWDEEIPTNVAINEAVELSKKFSGDEGPSFVNGVLAKLTKLEF